MSLRKMGRGVRVLSLAVICLATVEGLSINYLHAQGTTGAFQGTITDGTGAVIPGATVVATNMATNLQRSVQSNTSGFFVIPNLPPGRYRVQVSQQGFQTSVRENIELVVGQQLAFNTLLEIGEITQQVTVTGEAPVVNTTPAQVSGLVAEREVRDLPLDGRSFDNLITLNPGMVNITSATQERASTSTGAGSYFAVAGRKPGTNLFLWNGIEYPGGSSGFSGTPGGVSGQLLGVDAVQEFNVVANLDSAEFGQRTGGQVQAVVRSGTNTLHGSVYEFHRNSALDARNFFDREVPAFKRNQFGATLGGPIRRDKAFLFGNYEGFRERLSLGQVAIVPDAQARRGLLPDSEGVYRPVAGFNPAVIPYFALWPEPQEPLLNARGLPTGAALSFNSPPSAIREEFGTVKGDYIHSDRSTWSFAYTIDEGESDSPGPNPVSTNLNVITTQIVSLTETRVFSPSVVNRFTAGFSRVNYQLLLPVTADLPAGAEPWVKGMPMGAIRIGSALTGTTSAITYGGSGPGSGSQSIIITNLFTYDDQLHMTKGVHSLTSGVWFKRYQNNWDRYSYGSVRFDALADLLRGQAAEFVAEPWGPDTQAGRMWMGAWYVQDAMQLRPSLTLQLGLRHEFTDGYNDAQGEAVNYLIGPDGIVESVPRIASSHFTENRAKWLFGPRFGLAWDPFGRGNTSIRAGFGIAYNLLDNIAFLTSSAGPCPARVDCGVSIRPSPFPFQLLPFQPPPAALPVETGGGGPQADPNTPTVQTYRLEVEQSVGADMSLRVAYIGSRGFHDVYRAAANLNTHVICPAAAPQLTIAQGQQACAGLPEGTRYFPVGARRLNPALGTSTKMFTGGNNNYNSFQVDLNRRFRGGLAFRANYTFSKAMDEASSLSTFIAVGNPNNVLDPSDRKRDYGLSAYDVRNRFSTNASYELPFGAGKPFLSGYAGLADKLLSGWQLNGILSLQGGFPLTPLLGFSRSRNGNTGPADRPDWALGRTHDGIYLKRPERWFDATAFQLPVAGTYGNVGRNVLIGPGIANVSMSLFKTTQFTERVTMQFRAEVFNLFNRSNFGLPQPTALTPSGAPAAAAGLITRTATSSRQIQFGLKLSW